MIFFISKKYLKSATTSHFTDFSYPCLHCVKLTKAVGLLLYLLILNVHKRDDINALLLSTFRKTGRGAKLVGKSVAQLEIWLTKQVS